MSEKQIAFEESCKNSFNSLRESSEWEICDNIKIDSLKNSAMIILVKNSEDIILVNLNHHYSLGFRRFFILDNNSSDNTRDLIFSFKQEKADADVFYTTDYNVAHRQSVKTRAMAQFAESYLSEEDNPIDWFFPVDADEFITCCTKESTKASKQFTEFLMDADAEVLVFNWAQSALFSKNTQKITEFSENLSSTEFSTWKEMRVHVTKVAYRAGRKLTPNEGNHFVDGYNFEGNGIRSMTNIGFCLLHFPMRSVQQLKTKLEDGVKGLDAAKHTMSVGGHWRHYHNHYLRAGDKALYGLLMDHVNGCTD